MNRFHLSSMARLTRYTDMSYKRISPTPVVEGGTGKNSMTAYSVLCGGTTSTAAMQNVSGVGTSTQILTSNGASALPTWQPAVSGVGGPGSSTNRAIATWNGTTGTALFNNSTITIASGGQMVNTAQPAFTAYLSTPTTNTKFGDTTTYYTVLFDTKVFDQGTNYTTATGIFTAPVTGKYLFMVMCSVEAVSNALTFYTQGQLVTTARSYFTPPFTHDANNPNGFLNINATFLADMSTNDTASFAVAGGYTASTNSMGVYGSASPYFTYFSGFLVC